MPAALREMSFLKAVGKGAFGEVRLQVHAPTKRAYAVKVQKADGRFREMIDREVACMREAAPGVGKCRNWSTSEHCAHMLTCTGGAGL